MANPKLLTSIERFFRRRRFRVLSELCAQCSHRPIRILDVGGTPAYWQEVDATPLGDVQIVLLNISAPPVSPPFLAMVGDARSLPFRDKEFDIAYSNAVINLVGGPSDQARMAVEIRRVARSYAVQTPNRFFPIDWRTLVPCFHWLPAGVQAWCFRHLHVGLYPRIPDEKRARWHATRVRDVSRRELTQWFPGDKIISERVAWLTKSFIVTGPISLMASNDNSR
jgi:hypothetical protein